MYVLQLDIHLRMRLSRLPRCYSLLFRDLSDPLSLRAPSFPSGVTRSVDVSSPYADSPSLAEDILVHADSKNPDWMFFTGISSRDGRYLMMSTSKDTTRVSTHFNVFVVLLLTNDT